MQTLHRIRTALCLALPLAAAGCNGSNGSATGGGPIVTPSALLDLLRARGLNTLAELVETAALQGTLESLAALTLFAPTDAAFAALPAGELARLLDPANRAELRALVEYHAVLGTFDAATLEGLTSLMSVQGADLFVDAPGGVVFINEARLAVGDVAMANGLLHEVDAVLRPPAGLLETLEARGFTILRDLLDRASLAGTITGGNLTLIAPTDAAFQALPPGELAFLQDPANVAELEALLTFHMLPGAQPALAMLLAGDTPNVNADLIFACAEGHRLRLNDVPMELFNVPATDGLLHVASGVLRPTRTVREGLEELGLTTLVELIDLAGLTTALSTTGTWTVVAPSEAAFAALPPGEVDMLRDPANVTLRTEFLERYIGADATQALELQRLEVFETVGGHSYPVVAAADDILVGGVLVATRDHLASNGIVHTIDTVLPVP